MMMIDDDCDKEWWWPNGNMIAMSKRSLLDEKFWECLNFVELNEPTNPDIRN